MSSHGIPETDELMQNDNNNHGNDYSHTPTSAPDWRKVKPTYHIKPQPLPVKCKEDIVNELASYDVVEIFRESLHSIILKLRRKLTNMPTKEMTRLSCN